MRKPLDRFSDSSSLITTLVVLLSLVSLAIASSAGAATLNVDFEQDLTGGDTTHSGSDGVLSAGGTLWNSVEVATDEFDLADEAGNATGVDVLFPSGGSASGDSSSTNNLQDSGTFADFNITGLTSGETYTIAVYGGTSMGHAITSSTGSSGAFCTGSPTYALPGTADIDYCLYTNVMPADLGGGDFGFAFFSLDGLITGVQVSGALGGGGPAVPALSPAPMVLLVVLLITFVLTVQVVRRRES